MALLAESAFPLVAQIKKERHLTVRVCWHHGLTLLSILLLAASRYISISPVFEHSRGLQRRTKPDHWLREHLPRRYRWYPRLHRSLTWGRIRRDTHRQRLFGYRCLLYQRYRHEPSRGASIRLERLVRRSKAGILTQNTEKAVPIKAASNTSECWRIHCDCCASATA